MQVKRHCKYFAVLTILVAISAIVSINNTHNERARYIEKREYVIVLLNKVQEWAKANDVSPMYALLHSNYAMALLWAIKWAADDTQVIDIAKGMGIDLPLLQGMVVGKQDISHKNLVSTCKQLTPKTTATGAPTGASTATPSLNASKIALS